MRRNPILLGFPVGWMRNGPATALRRRPERRPTAARGGVIDEQSSAGGVGGPETPGPPAASRSVPPPVVPPRVVPPPAAAAPAWPPTASPQEAAPQPARQTALPTAAATPGEPFYLPAADWRWGRSLIGLALGSAPEALLYLTALLAGASAASGGKVTAGSAAALAIGSLVLYGWEALAAWLFSLRTAGRKFALWGFRRPTKAFFWTIPVALLAVYAVGIVHDMIIHPQQQDLISEFPRGPLGLGLFVLVAVVMAPLFEEIVFRGFLFRGLANSWGWKWGALASAALFGLAHLQLDIFIPLATLGFGLAWVYKRTGSLWTCIAMHALFNLIAVVAWALTG